MAEQAALDELVRRCRDVGDESVLKPPKPVILMGTAVGAPPGSIGLRIGKRVVVYVRTKDVLDANQESGSEEFRISVLPQTAIVLKCGEGTHVVSAQFDPSNLLRIGTASHSSGPAGVVGHARLSRPPWLHSPEFWTCLGSAASGCDGRYGPLYDDNGFMNGELIDCYMDGVGSCEVLEGALPD